MTKKYSRTVHIYSPSPHIKASNKPLSTTTSKYFPSSSSSISTASILAQFEHVNQAVSILQLEKPSDWLAFSYKVGDSNETNLTADEIQKVMGLRLDFTEEAIARVCIQIGANT